MDTGWQVQLDHGWVAWFPGDKQFNGPQDTPLKYVVGKWDFEARFTSPTEGEQVNLTTKKSRPLRLRPEGEDPEPAPGPPPQRGSARTPPAVPAKPKAARTVRQTTVPAESPSLDRLCRPIGRSRPSQSRGGYGGEAAETSARSAGPSAALQATPASPAASGRATLVQDPVRSRGSSRVTPSLAAPLRDQAARAAPKRASVGGYAQRPTPAANQGLWEIELARGWAPWTPPVSAQAFGPDAGPIRYAFGKTEFEAVFETPTSGVQRNLITGTTRAIRKVGGGVDERARPPVADSDGVQ